jgi:hypothetical protein
MKVVLRCLHDPDVDRHSWWSSKPRQHPERGRESAGRGRGDSRLRGAALLVSVCLLAACGSGTSSSAKLETAISSTHVADLFGGKTGLVAVATPLCVPTTLPGDYTCTGKPTFVACPRNASPTKPCASPTAPTKVWIACYPATDRYAFSCQREEAPAGTNVFVTTAQRAAKKSAEWRCPTKTIDGTPIGPFTLTTAESFGPVETQPNYVTKTQAESLASKLHVPLAIDCG